MSYRVVFMGTADLACPSLVALATTPPFQVTGVVTQPDRPKGRDLKLQPSAVKRTALELNLPVFQPERARDAAFVGLLREMTPDVIVVAAYGQLLPLSILSLPAQGCVNVHASLLPKYRGAAPIQWAILNDESETGITIMQMAEKLDAGAILTQRATPIASEDDAATLHDRLAKIGADLLIETVPKYVAGQITAQPQSEADATYARKITKDDGRIDWSQPARALWNRIRAFTPWPGAFTRIIENDKQRVLKIWQASVVEGPAGPPGRIEVAGKDALVVACGSGGLRIHELQLESGRRLTAAQFLAGHHFQLGDKLG